MNRLSIEVKVGIVVTVAVALVLAFLVLLGNYNPFSNTYRIHVVLNYAGSIQPGSAVQVAGAKVGQVESISFFESGHKWSGQEVALDVTLKIDKRAQHMIRKDSRVYINMEGFIGGKYVEVEPGTATSSLLQDNDTLRGIDPPRIEQFLSQGFDIFERLTSLFSELGLDDRTKLKSALDNLVQISENMNVITSRLKDNIDPMLTDTQAILSQTRGMVADLKNVLQQTNPMIKKVNAILADLDNVSSELGHLDKKKKEEVRARLDELLSMVTKMDQLVTRLDSLSAKMETEVGTLNRDELERIFREYLQNEGITVNVGTVVGKPQYKKEEKK